MRVTDIKHACLPPTDRGEVETFQGVREVVMRWKCPECKQRWRVTLGNGYGNAVRIGYASWMWRRAAAREIERRNRT